MNKETINSKSQLSVSGDTPIQTLDGCFSERDFKISTSEFVRALNNLAQASPESAVSISDSIIEVLAAEKLITLVSIAEYNLNIREFSTLPALVQLERRLGEQLKIAEHEKHELVLQLRDLEEKEMLLPKNVEEACKYLEECLTVSDSLIRVGFYNLFHKKPICDATAEASEGLSRARDLEAQVNQLSGELEKSNLTLQTMQGAQSEIIKEIKRIELQNEANNICVRLPNSYCRLDSIVTRNLPALSNLSISDDTQINIHDALMLVNDLLSGSKKSPILTARYEILSTTLAFQKIAQVSETLGTASTSKRQPASKLYTAGFEPLETDEKWTHALFVASSELTNSIEPSRFQECRTTVKEFVAKHSDIFSHRVNDIDYLAVRMALRSPEKGNQLCHDAFSYLRGGVALEKFIPIAQATWLVEAEEVIPGTISRDKQLQRLKDRTGGTFGSAWRNILALSSLDISDASYQFNKNVPLDRLSHLGQDLALGLAVLLHNGARINDLTWKILSELSSIHKRSFSSSCTIETLQAFTYVHLLKDLTSETSPDSKKRDYLVLQRCLLSNIVAHQRYYPYFCNWEAEEAARDRHLQAEEQAKRTAEMLTLNWQRVDSPYEFSPRNY